MANSPTRHLQGAEFVKADLRGARFVESDLSGVVMRGVEVSAAEIDAPWLPHSPSFLVNDVDVIPLVEAELNRRFPGRGDRRATDPDGLRSAWAAIEGTWAATLARVAAMPTAAVDVSVAGEWSFTQTLRHLVCHGHCGCAGRSWRWTSPTTPSAWLRRPGGDGVDPSTVTTSTPTYADVLETRADRVAMVRDFLADVTPESWPRRTAARTPRLQGDHPLPPARDPRGGVGAPPLRCTRSRCDRGEARRVNRRRPS